MYEAYDLIDNPFKLEHDHPIVGKSQNDTFDKVLDLFRANSAFKTRTGDRFLAAFKGDYGFGKSFFLTQIAIASSKKTKRFREQIKEDVDILVSYFPILPPEKKLPNKLLVHLYRSIMENLGNNGEQVIEDICKKLEDRSKATGEKMEVILAGLDSTYRKILLGISKDPSIQYLSIRWIMGHPLSSRELKEIGVPFCINTPELAEKYIFQFLKLLNISGYGLLAVLIDELEQVLTVVSEKQFLRTFIVFQEIFDRYEDLKYSPLKPLCPIGFLIGLTPQAWDTVEIGAEEEKGITAVRSRIHNNIFEIERFNEEDTREFMCMLLKKARTPEFRGDKLFPFEPEVVRLIWEHSYGNPREIINDCKSMLGKAAKISAARIDIDLANEYYRKIGGSDIRIEVTDEEDKSFLDEEEKI